MAQLQHLFTEPVAITKWAGQDQYGQPIFGSSTSYLARIEPVVARDNGANAALYGKVKVILSEHVQVDPRDSVNIPSSYGSRNSDGNFESPTVTIMEVKHLVDSTGQAVSTVLICGRA